MLTEVVGWSEDNRRLYALLKKHGYAAFICNREFLYEHYKTIKLTKVGINRIDGESTQFKNLHHLDISFNRVMALENCPENVV